MAGDAMREAQALYDWLAEHFDLSQAGGGSRPIGPVAIANALKRVQPVGHLGESDDERRVMGLILDAMEGIKSLNGRKLRANEAELAQAIHVLQGFVRQATLARLGLFGSNDWWEDLESNG